MPTLHIMENLLRFDDAVRSLCDRDNRHHEIVNGNTLPKLNISLGDIELIKKWKNEFSGKQPSKKQYNQVREFLDAFNLWK